MRTGLISLCCEPTLLTTAFEVCVTRFLPTHADSEQCANVFSVFLFCYDLMVALPLFDQTAAGAGVLCRRLRPSVSCCCRLAALQGAKSGLKSTEPTRITRSDCAFIDLGQTISSLMCLTALI